MPLNFLAHEAGAIDTTWGLDMLWPWVVGILPEAVLARKHKRGRAVLSSLPGSH